MSGFGHDDDAVVGLVEDVKEVNSTFEQMKFTARRKLVDLKQTFESTVAEVCHSVCLSVCVSLSTCYVNVMWRLFNIMMMIIRQFIRRRNMSTKSLQGRVTPGSRDECRTAPDDPWTKPTDLSHRPACRQLRNIHHRYLLLLSQKADSHFTIPQRVEGWVDLDGWLYIQTVYLPVISHPSK